MSEQQMDLREEVDIYNQKHGRETEGAEGYRNFLNAVYTSPRWRSRLAAWKEKTKKTELHAARPKPTTSAQDQAIVTNWLNEENARRKAHNANLTSGQIGLPPLELGYSAGMITMENAIHAAKLAHEQKLLDYDDQVTAAARARQQYLQAENERANKVLHQPIDPNDPVYQKYKNRLTPITDQQIDEYSKWPVVDLQRAIDHVKYEAGLTIGTLSEHEWACVARWIQTNGLDPLGEENWVTGALTLTELAIIKRQSLGPVTVDIEPPKLPEVTERPVPETIPTGRATQEAQRLKDTLRDIRQTLGYYLTEIEQHDAVNPAEDQVVFNLYDSLLGKEITRNSVRKAFFYSALKVRGQRPAGFTDDEIETWATDQPAMNQVSAAEYKRQMALYGDVRLHRVPDKQTALLEQLVKQTARKS